MSLESEEKSNTGINNLKLAITESLDIIFEVTKSNLQLVLEYFIRRQTLANSERYYTEELKVLEEKILNADERISILEDLIFNQICDEISKYKADILLMSNDVSIIDSIYSFI